MMQVTIICKHFIFLHIQFSLISTVGKTLLIFAISVLFCNVKVLKLQAAIKYGEEDLQGAKVHKK